MMSIVDLFMGDIVSPLLQWLAKKASHEPFLPKICRYLHIQSHKVGFIKATEAA